MTLRILVPLLLILGLLAWGATIVVDSTTRAWFERDVSLRARLVAGSAREALVGDVRRDDLRRAQKFLEALAREDRVLGGALCTPGMKTMVASRGLPVAYRCEDLVADAVAADRPEGVDLPPRTGGPRLQAALIPLRDGADIAARLLLVHDLGFMANRGASVRRFTMVAFGVVALVASAAALALRRFSLQRWTEELRGLLARGRRTVGRGALSDEKLFAPLASDLRAMFADLAAEHGVPTTGRWTPERLHQTLNESLEGEGVVVLANREPYIHDRRPDGSTQVQHPASGLVTALEPVMRACSGVWIAHGSGSADRETVDRHDRVLVPPGEESYSLRRVWLSAEEERGYYYGFSNEGLWPLCHLVYTRPTFRANDFRSYHSVNRRFAQAARDEVDGPDPIVLVQDYHFALAPRMVREALPGATVLTFWHIPWPHAERLGVCPWAKELLTGLLGSSILGFHTQQHCNNFLECVDRYLEARVDRERMSVVLGGRETLVRAYPISIEWPNRWALAAPPTERCREELRAELGLRSDVLLGIGVDRLDYTKGIEERLLAVERAFERFPQLRGGFTFAQLSAPSRTLIPEYRDLDGRVTAIAERINARFATPSWRPVALMRGHHEAPDVFRAMRAADLCYVSSLDDGMNLVAKEFVASRDDERGVLVLSRFTGAARELTEALLVNPYDLEEASAALSAALSMSPAEQGERMRALRAQVADANVYRWAGRMLFDAARLRNRHRMSNRLSVVPSPAQEIRA